MDRRQEAIIQVSRQLGITNPEWLVKLIGFETADTYDPMKKNPTSSARGLIQFMDSTARDMGYRDSLELVTRYPAFVSQLYYPVEIYLRTYRPFPTETSLYMAVFYPKYRKAPMNQQFPDRVQRANPGIRTVGDYVSKVSRRMLPPWWQRESKVTAASSLPADAPWWKWLLAAAVFPFLIGKLLLKGGKGRGRNRK